MFLQFKIENRSFEIDTDVYFKISIPLHFNADQPNAYNVPKAKADSLGNTNNGDGCNYDAVSLIPHCNGTHTECIGHITNKDFTINQQLKDSFIPATLITVESLLDGDDFIVSRAMLENALANCDQGFMDALIIRTSPNEAAKLMRNYSHYPAPYVSSEAMEFIVSLGINHLLVDFPSVDKAEDKGVLDAHHVFWNMTDHVAGEDAELNKTITEMVFVSDSVVDGIYLLNLQVAPFELDAAPSRPILFELKK